MDKIFIIIISMMGSNTWETREVGSFCFAYCCELDLLSYEQEMAALNHEDLEVRHRAEVVLEKHYSLEEGHINQNRRLFALKSIDSNQLEQFRKEKEALGWVHDSTYINGNYRQINGGIIDYVVYFTRKP